jgi:hypothetical protein
MRARGNEPAIVKLGAFAERLPEIFRHFDRAGAGAIFEVDVRIVEPECCWDGHALILQPLWLMINGPSGLLQRPCCSAATITASCSQHTRLAFDRNAQHGACSSGEMRKSKIAIDCALTIPKDCVSWLLRGGVKQSPQHRTEVTR